MIKYAINGERIATITLDRDDKRNAINREMAGQLMQRLSEAGQEARVVVLRANPGAKVWCAGHDLTELDPQALQAGNPTLDIVARLQTVPVPVLAMVEGSVYAGGLLVLLASDLVIADESAQVAITSGILGIPLEIELYAYWSQVMGMHKIKEMLFTATSISAEDARCAGLYNRVVEPERLEPTTYELARRMLRCAPQSLANTKQQLNLLAMRSSLTDADRKEVQRQNAEILNSADTKARIQHLLKSLRKPD